MASESMYSNASVGGMEFSSLCVLWTSLWLLDRHCQCNCIIAHWVPIATAAAAAAAAPGAVAYGLTSNDVTCSPSTKRCQCAGPTASDVAGGVSQKPFRTRLQKKKKKKRYGQRGPLCVSSSPSRCFTLATLLLNRALPMCRRLPNRGHQLPATSVILSILLLIESRTFAPTDICPPERKLPSRTSVRRT